MKIVASTESNTAFKEFNNLHWPSEDLEHYGKILDWTSKNYNLTVYDKKNQVIGALGFKVEVDVAYIGTLIVAKTQRGSGIGSKLMKEAEKIAKEQGAHKIYLVTGKGWKSMKFYEKIGYKVTGELPDHYFHKDFVYLSKIL